MPELLTVQEVARWLKISAKAVYAKSERGCLPGATRLGRRLYFFRSELLRLVEQNRVPTLGDPDVST
jgi:excisionase family DNA binding protein